MVPTLALLSTIQVTYDPCSPRAGPCLAAAPGWCRLPPFPCEATSNVVVIETAPELSARPSTLPTIPPDTPPNRRIDSRAESTPPVAHRHGRRSPRCCIAVCVCPCVATAATGSTTSKISASGQRETVPPADASPTTGAGARCCTGPPTHPALPAVPRGWRTRGRRLQRTRPHRLMKALNLSRRGRRARSGQQMPDPVLHTDPIKQNFRRRTTWANPPVNTFRCQSKTCSGTPVAVQRTQTAPHIPGAPWPARPPSPTPRTASCHRCRSPP